MAIRAKVTLALIVVGLVVAGSFAAGMYYRFKGPAAVPLATAPAVSVADLLAKASQYLQVRKTEQALVLYRQALARQPDSVEAQLGIARAEFSAGREEEAAREYERVVKLDVQNATAVLQLAKIYARHARTWPLAERELRQYLALRPNDAEEQLQLARLLAWQRKWKEAAAAYSRQAALGRTDRKEYVFTLLNSGQSQRAEVVLKQALAAGDNDLDLREQLGSLYAARQDWNSALPLYASLVKAKPDDANLNLTYGVGLLTQKQYAASLAPLAKASTAMPDNPQAGLAYARGLKGAGDYRQAEKQYERILPALAANPAIHREYADFLFQKKDFRKAEKQYKAAYDLGLRDPRLLVGLSGALRAQDKPRQALPYLEEAYKQDPTDRLALELAKVLHQVGQNQRAVALLSKIQNQSARQSAP